MPHCVKTAGRPERGGHLSPFEPRSRVTMSAESLAEALANRLSSIVDPKLRVAYLRHALRQVDLSTVVDLVLIVHARVQARQGDFDVLALSLSMALTEPDADGLSVAVAAAAEARGQPQIARLLRAESDVDEEDGNRLPVPTGREKRPLTLGERKALARRGDRRLLEKALRDPHPDVIEILLGNPMLTEDDVIRLAARRSVAPEVLRSVFRSTRWIVRERVRRTLVRNPRCPIDVALKLAMLLNAQDAREVAASPELDPELRKACSGERDEGSLH